MKDSASRFISGLNNITSARIELENTIRAIGHVGQKELDLWAKNNFSRLDFFSKGEMHSYPWSILPNWPDVGSWAIMYAAEHVCFRTPFSGVTNPFSYYQLKGGLVIGARARLHLLVDGLVANIPGLSSRLEHFFEAADA